MVALTIVSCALGVIFLAWFLSLRQEQQTVASITADRVAPLHQLFVIARDLTDIQGQLPRLSGDATLDQKPIGRILVLRQAIDAEWARYARTYLTDEEQILARQTHRLLASTESSLTRLLDLYEREQRARLSVELGDRLRPNVDALQVSLQQLVDLQEEVSYAAYAETEQLNSQAIAAMLLAAALGIAAVAYAAVLIRRSVLAPMSGARQAMAGIARGQLDVAIPHSDAREVSAFLDELRDLKERFGGMHAERQLDRRRVEEFRARLEAVFKHCPFGIFIKDLDGRFILLNETEAKLWGHPSEAFVGRASEDFIAPHDLPRVLETDRQVAETGEPVVIEYRGTAETHYDWLQTVKFPIRGSGGELIAIGGIDIDISERRRSEQTLRRYTHHLGRATQLAKIMFWIMRIDTATGKWIREYDPDRMREWCGWDALPVDYETYLADYIHPEDQAKARSTYEGFLAGEYDSYVMEYRLRRPDGSYFPIRSWRERTIDPISGDINVFALSQDITEERRRETALMAAVRRAESADRAKTDFLRIMSHELRTPLNPILGFSELLRLKSEQQGDAGNAEYLKLIHDGAQNLLAIINTILEFARIDAADTKLEDGEFDVAAALGTCAGSVAARAAEIGASIAIDVRPAGLRMRADESAFRQAVGNILANALRFTPASSVVEVAAVESDDGIRIAVADAGPGFDPAVLEQLGKPFVRGGNAFSQSHGGVGLGLTVAHKLMEMHAGRLEAVNRPGGGARVTLVFPRSRRAIAEPMPKPSRRSAGR